jgi:hypothetical protein
MQLSTEAAVWEITRTISELSPADAQQKDNLCGPFHAARLLRDAGIAEWEGEPIDQDLIALHAGTRLPVVELGPQVPPGAASLRDYRYDLRRVDQELAGTSARGLAAAIERLSCGRLVCVPLTGKWTRLVVEKLLEAAPDSAVRLIGNIRTGHLWGSHPPLEALMAVLEGEEVPEPPPADWDAGHFVELMQLLRGRHGTLVIVRDSYPSLGWRGVYLQPPTALAAALTRGDGRGGGVLAVAQPERTGELEERARELGLKTEIWDN